MANSNVAMYIQTIQNWSVQILPADTTSNKTIITAGAQGSRVESLIVSSTDTAGRDVQIGVTRSATNYIIGTVAIPINAGNTNAVPNVNLFANTGQIIGLALDSNGNPYLDLKASDVLYIAALTTVTTAKVISAIAYGGDF